MEILQVQKFVILGGLFTGCIFGFFAQRIRFCVLGAISDLVIIGNPSRASIYAVACTTGVILTQTLILFNLIQINSSPVSKDNVIWFSSIFGGLIFGFGMSLASGCTSRAIIRVAEGDMKAVVVLMAAAASAIMTMRGFIAPLRVNFFDQINFSTNGHIDSISILSKLTVFDENVRVFTIFCFTFLLFTLFLLNFYNKKKDNDELRKNLFYSILIGVAVASGWLVTGNLGFVAEHPDTLEFAYIGTNSNSIESLSFVGPIAYSSEILMYWTDSSKELTFGISIIIGTFFGASISSLQKKVYLIQGFNSSQDFFYHLVGGIFMGIGGVTAVGCSIGHGLSGMSFLSISSIIVTVSMILGTFIGLMYIQRKI